MRDFTESTEMPTAIKLNQDRERLSKRCKEVEKNMKKAQQHYQTKNTRCEQTSVLAQKTF